MRAGSGCSPSMHMASPPRERVGSICSASFPVCMGLVPMYLVPFILSCDRP